MAYKSSLLIEMDDSTPPAISIEDSWRAHKRRVFDVAYRMLGSVSEADDVTQEAYARLVRVGLDGIQDPLGWLITVTARLCLDHMRSSVARRTAYVGPWLPEPLVNTNSALSPEERVTLDDSVRMALLVVLETLSPAERAAFVLHDVFGLPFGEIAELVGRSTEACRQLASRARRRVADSGAIGRFTTSRSQLARTAEEFANACESGNFEALLRILDSEVAGTFDSGGRVVGAPVGPIRGRERVARVILRAFSGTAAHFEVVDVNGEPGVTITVGDEVRAVVALSVRSGRIVHIDAVGNPDKLGHLQ
jgi:RNA polymerase sigma-70 factor, ECF subfamily